MFNPQTTTTKAKYLYGTLIALLLAASLLLMVSARPAHASTTFTVKNTNDSGADSLRQAILDANATTGADIINFNIPETFRDPSTGVATIKPTSQLPFVNDTVTINGYSQPGASPNTRNVGSNARLKVQLDGSEAGAASGLIITGSDVVVRGLVVNRFSNQGIETSGEVATNVRIEGNFVGTNPSGTAARPNDGDGVDISSDNVTVGGSTPDKRNLISGNDVDGLSISSGNGVLVEGNLIGTAKDGIAPLDNGFNGVDVSSGDTGNTILGNSIFSNGQLGIDLGVNGRTLNDPGDTDLGANNLQNFPVLTSAKTASGKTTIKGKLNSTPNALFTVQFFSNPAGNEGKRFIGQKSVSTLGNGDVSFTFVPKQAVGVGQDITATATKNFTGDTSEFSGARKVVKAS